MQANYLGVVSGAARAMVFVFLFTASSTQAQFRLAPLTTFGTNGWLAPNGYNGSTYTYLGTSDTERGLAYGNNHLYLVSRNGGDFVRVLEARTGQDLGALNLGTNVVTGGTFNVNMVVAADDGAIYLANLATGPSSLKIYRWTNDLPTTTPTLVYNSVPLAGARVGDSLAIIGSGGTTRLAAGFNGTPNVTGNNGYAVIDPTSGTATAVGFSTTPPAAGDFRLGISFIDATHVIGTQGGSGGALQYTSFSGSTGLLLASPLLATTDERPVSFITVEGFPLLATLSTVDSHVTLYDMRNPANPVLVAQTNATTGTLPANSHNTGAIAWGNIQGNTATLYALSTDQGIQAFTITTPQPEPAVIVSQPQSQTVVELAPVTFQVAATGNPSPDFQWYQNDKLIVGATGSSYSILTAPLSDNGAAFKVVAANVIGNVTHSVTSQVAVLTVLADTNPPVLLGAQSLGLSRVEVLISERVTPVTATNLSNYALTSSNGSLAVTGAVLAPSQSAIVLDVTMMAEGTVYTLTVNHLIDQSTAANEIAANSQVTFIPRLYVSSSIGNPALAGTQTAVADGYDITGGGFDLGGTTDQCNFSYQPRTGDFDVAVRLAELSALDVWAKAGLMARETLDPGSRFAAALATPAMVGAFFAWRSSSNSASSTGGYFPGNYPNAWLRLQRAGNIFTGFASYDGQSWTPLAGATLAMPSQIYLGMTVSSHDTNQTTLAQFRGLTEVTNALVGSVSSRYEPLGPCSRRTQLAISEIMYRPPPRADGLNLEYLEIYNSNPWWEDISQYRLEGPVQYTFPTNTIIQGGAFLVVAAAPNAMRQVYGITNVLGPYNHSLKKLTSLRLVTDTGAILLEVPYSNALPWPAGADGTGHSIVLARPSYGEADPRAWTLSDQVGGSPGGLDSFQPSPLRNVVINEFLANADDAPVGYVEVYNHSGVAVDLSGCVLTDSALTNRFAVPANTVIAPGGFLSFESTQLGFTLNPAGGLLLLKAPDGLRVLDAVSFEPQARNISCGRWPDGAAEFYPLAARTPGAPNGDILIGDIVINEIMYKPISNNDDDQYVELFNQGSNTMDMMGWQFTAGINFKFTNHALIAPGGYLIVARNAANLFAHYTQLNAGNTAGDYTGKLPHGGGRLAIARPEAVVATGASGVVATNTIYVVEDEVTYQTGGRWGLWAHGGGSSLELINPKTNHRLASNWADSDETSKSSWSNLQYTGVLDNGPPSNANYGRSRIDLVQVGLLDVGECLLDNLEVLRDPNGTNFLRNGDFEAGTAGWTMQGDHIRSSIETSAGLGGYQSSQSLHVRSSDGIWTGANSVQGTLTNTTLAAGQTATLSLMGRWLRGSPEVLMRLRGNWLELTGALPVPANLGTPGLRNSRAVSQAGPAIFEVKHSPAIPAANQAVVVTARMHDTGHFQATLQYRIDTGVNPSPTYKSVVMLDNGSAGDEVAGDGLYSAVIPAQTAGTVVAFVIQAQDDIGASTIFPADLKDNSGHPRECVVRFGDLIPGGSFGHYHLWLTQNWISRWSNFQGLANENNDATFVDGSGRIIYNVAGRFAGSPYHQYTGSPVTTVGGMHWTMPDDDKMLGNSSFNKQHVPGNSPLDDKTLQREQTSFWMARQLGLPWNYRRYYVLYVNGNRHGPLMEDSQVPGGDLLREYFPNDNNGFLHKNNAWFEFDPNGQGFDNDSWCTLNRYTTISNGVSQHKLARYRWNYWMRQYPDSANNYTNVLALIDAANTPTSNPAYANNLDNLVDTEEWMRMSAVEHATGDWDSFTTQNQWNMYVYKPLKGRWTLLKWDWNITLGNSGSWGPDGGQLFTISGSDPKQSAFLNYPPYLRAYLRAFKELANGPMNTNNVNPMLDARYAAFAANGLTKSYTVTEPGAAGLKGWINTMHNSLLSALASRGVANVSFAVNGPQAITTGTNFVTLAGSAPLEVRSIAVNGVAYPVTWTSVKNWSITFPIYQATNLLMIQGYDRQGGALSNATLAISVTDTNPLPVIQPLVRINEWMASNQHTAIDPADGQTHDWLELYNPSSDRVSVAGCFLTDDLANQTKWLVPAGTVITPLGFLLVWADGGLANTNASTDSSLHAAFQLNKAGGFIGLYAANGFPIDEIIYGVQGPDISQGLWPDGGDNRYFMTTPTPGAPNALPPPPSLRLTAPKQTGAGIELIVEGPFGSGFTLQYSTNMANWTSMFATNLAATPLLLYDTNGVIPQKFYRATVP